MKNKLINFKEWDGHEIHSMLLSDQVAELEWLIVKCTDKKECEQLRKRLSLVNDALNKNRIDFSM